MTDTPVDLDELERALRFSIAAAEAGDSAFARGIIATNRRMLAVIAELRAARAPVKVGAATRASVKARVFGELVSKQANELRELKEAAPAADEVAGLLEDIEWLRQNGELSDVDQQETLDRIENHLKGKR